MSLGSEGGTDRKGILGKMLHFYEHKHRFLTIFSFIILFLALVQIGFQLATEGDFIHKGISLKGGVTVTIPTEQNIDIIKLRNDLSSSFNDAAVRGLSGTTGGTSGIIIEADVSIENTAQTNQLLEAIRASTGLALEKGDYSMDGMGASLGASFFRETLLILLGSFVLMTLVVFIAFRSFIPSAAVILAAFGDMVVTIAVLNLFGFTFSTAGIAALLMLIGYSVDTDILLTTKVLKEKFGTFNERVHRAMKTGSFMTFATLSVAIVGYFFTNAETIKEIMRVIVIGSIADLIFTWFQNVGILRWYVKKKEGQHG